MHLHAGVLGLPDTMWSHRSWGSSVWAVARYPLARDACRGILVPGLLVTPRLNLLGIAHFLLLALVPACVGEGTPQWMNMARNFISAPPSGSLTPVLAAGIA